MKLSREDALELALINERSLSIEMQRQAITTEWNRLLDDYNKIMARNGLCGGHSGIPISLEGTTKLARIELDRTSPNFGVVTVVERPGLPAEPPKKEPSP